MTVVVWMLQCYVACNSNRTALVSPCENSSKPSMTFLFTFSVLMGIQWDSAICRSIPTTCLRASTQDHHKFNRSPPKVEKKPKRKSTASGAASVKKPKQDCGDEESPRDCRVDGKWKAYNLHELGIPFCAFPSSKKVNKGAHGYTVVCPVTNAAPQL